MGKPATLKLTSYHEAILDALRKYYFLTTDQFNRAWGSPGGITRARRYFAALREAQYIQIDNWVGRPGIFGKPWPVYTLTDTGRRYLVKQGRVVPAAYIPGEEHSDFFLKHTLSINDVLVATERFARTNAGVDINRVFHEKDLKHEPFRYKPAEGPTVVFAPDAWVEFYISTPRGTNIEAFELELDRGTEDRQKWKSKVQAILRWRDQAPDQDLQTDIVAVVAAMGENRQDTDTGRIKRMGKLREWTEQVLDTEGRKKEAGAFYFIAADPARVEADELFCAPVWLHPFSPTPVPLLRSQEELSRAS